MQNILADVQGGLGRGCNNRATQPQNGRDVVKSFQEDPAVVLHGGALVASPTTSSSTSSDNSGKLGPLPLWSRASRPVSEGSPCWPELLQIAFRLLHCQRVQALKKAVGHVVHGGHRTRRNAGAQHPAGTDCIPWLWGEASASSSSVVAMRSSWPRSAFALANRGSMTIL